MSEGIFSDLPANLHAGVRPAWTGDVRPASALLGRTDPVQQEIASAISDLPDEVHTAMGSELQHYRAERDKAIEDFAHRIMMTDKDGCELEGAEALLDELLAETFDRKFLPLDSDTLQELVNELVTDNRPGTLSPLFTVWSERLRKQGERHPKLNITCPEGKGGWQINFGIGMRDVDLTIEGHVSAELGTSATDCRFTVTDFEGDLLRGAKKCTVVGNKISGYVFNEAENCTIQCDDLESPSILLEDSCKLTATEVKCSSIHGTETQEGFAPCEVTIQVLRGKISPEKDWSVSIQETIEPPRQKPSHNPKSTPSGPITYQSIITESKISENNSIYIHENEDSLIDKIGSIGKGVFTGIPLGKGHAPEDSLTQEDYSSIQEIVLERDNRRIEKFSSSLGAFALKRIEIDEEIASAAKIVIDEHIHRLKDGDKQ